MTGEDIGNPPDLQVGNYPADAVLSAVGIIRGMSASRLSPDVPPLVREIHRRMVEAGLNPYSLAQKVGRGESYFRDLFRGKSRTVSGEFLPSIAAALGCSEEDLLRPGKADSGPSPGGEPDEVKEAALLGFWRMLTEQGQRRVMELIIREAFSILNNKSRD